MRRALPPLNALRAFEAAGRHMSFTRAANELAVTQAAISHQVKSLEQWIGAPLFKRGNRMLLLTDLGQAYHLIARDALDRLSTGTERLLKRDRSGVLTVTTLASFAAKWLVPRLGRFRALHPDIDVRLQSADHTVDFTTEDVDVGIRHGRGNWPYLASWHLMSEELFVVCSPLLMAGPVPLRQPSDVAKHVLLHDETRQDWDKWLKAAEVTGVDAGRGYTFTHSDLMLQAAINGDGIALARSVLVGDDLAAGRLIRPFELTLQGNFSYYIICRTEDSERPKITAFRNWMLEEAERSGLDGPKRFGVDGPPRPARDEAM